MIIKTLYVHQFRNLTSQTVAFNERLNFIVGDNASGKTALLEAIYFLARARSFRINDNKKLIQQGQDYCQVVASFIDQQHLGIEQNKNTLKMRLNGEDVAQKSILARLLPVLFLGPDSQILLSGPPAVRRKFIDWGLFHTQPHYQQLWLRYERTLKQRNAALKKHLTDAVLNSLDQELASSGEDITSARQHYCQLLNALATKYVAHFLPIPIQLSVSLQTGYASPLDKQLALSRPSDRMMGFTRYGAHRSEIAIKVDEKLAIHHLSRGHLKLLTIALMLAQLDLYQQKTTQPAILLMDDIAAELDQKRRTHLLHTLSELNAQLFVTALSLDDFPELITPSLSPLHSQYHLNAGTIEMV